MEYPIPGAGLHRPVLRGRFSGAQFGIVFSLD